MLVLEFEAESYGQGVAFSWLLLDNDANDLINFVNTTDCPLLGLQGVAAGIQGVAKLSGDCEDALTESSVNCVFFE